MKKKKKEAIQRVEEVVMDLFLKDRCHLYLLGGISSFLFWEVGMRACVCVVGGGGFVWRGTYDIFGFVRLEV